MEEKLIIEMGVDWSTVQYKEMLHTRPTQPDKEKSNKIMPFNTLTHSSHTW